MGGKRSRARRSDHQQRSADGERQGQPEQEHERGHDDKAAADPEEARQDARSDTDSCHARERELAALLDGVAPPEQHCGCGGKQQYGEAEQQRRAADEPVQRCARDRAGRAGRSERQSGPDLHAADPGVVGGAGQGGGTDDEQ